MSFWNKLFGKDNSTSQTKVSQKGGGNLSPTPRSSANAARVDPRSITHIILIVDKSEPITSVRDIPNLVDDLWRRANPDMARVLASANIGIPCYYVEAARKHANGQINTDHFLGAHLSKLHVPNEHSVFVQLYTLGMDDGVTRDITLETIYRTSESVCVVSEKPLSPYVA